MAEKESDCDRFGIGRAWLLEGEPSCGVKEQVPKLSDDRPPSSHGKRRVGGGHDAVNSRRAAEARFLFF